MADAIVSTVAGRLVSLIEEQARYHINLVVGAEKEVLKLAKELETVRDVLDDAENKQFKDKSIKNWLVRLEKTSFEMDDILDEWNYAILKFQMECDTSDGVVVAPPKQKVWSFIPSPSCLCFKKAALRHGIAKKIIDVKEKLDEVLKLDERYKLTISQSTSDPLPNSWRDQSTSFANLEVVRGRDSDRDILVTKLMGRQEELGLQVVSIVGVGGLGKTTLAQLVYNDSEIEKSFDLRIWVCVSDPFDLVSIAKGILESVGIGSSPNTTQLDVLLRNVKRSIQGKRFLLVLDDVWTEDPKKWETLKSPLKFGGAGSKVLVTTRNQNAAEIMDTMDNDIHHLGKLTDEGCWRLLCDEACLGRNKENFEAFKDISMAIAKKCRGLPLAAKVLGSLLRSNRSLEDWENVLNSEIWQLEKAELELFPHLLLSYNELSPMHKRCFSYCASFPKDSKIYVEDLVQKWMALGYLGSNTSDLELKGHECFDFLAMRSLFQDFKEVGEIRSCKMHDIVHDFAQSLRKSGGSEAIGLDKTTCGACDPPINPSVISTVNEFCSLSIFYCNDIPESICNCFKRLKVFKIPGFPKGMENLIHLRWLKIDASELSCEDLKIIFKLYNLQTLLLIYCKIKEIPSEIGNLIHLRCLDLSYNDNMKELPENICDLTELRTLNVEGCKRLFRLPEGMHRFINLKHLRNNCTADLKQLPQGLAKVNGLRTLSELRVGGDGFSKSGLLKNLNRLSGFLCLAIRLSDDYVEDVVNDAQEAELREKEDLQEFWIAFSDSRNNKEGSPSLWLGIIDALEPHPNLKHLTIYSYGGSQLPSWIAAPPLIHLTRITIKSCHHISSLPPLGKLECLEEIKIDNTRALQIVGREFLGITTKNGGEAASTSSSTIDAFPNLKKLSFNWCRGWEKWEDITAEEEESAHLVFMPRLTTLEIEYCHNLEELPVRLLSKMSSLEKLRLRGSRMLQEWCVKEGKSVGKSVFQNPRLQIT